MCISSLSPAASTSAPFRIQWRQRTQLFLFITDWPSSRIRGRLQTCPNFEPSPILEHLLLPSIPDSVRFPWFWLSVLFLPSHSGFICAKRSNWMRLVSLCDPDLMALSLARPPLPQDFFKIMQSSGNFKEKNPILSKFWAQAQRAY